MNLVGYSLGYLLSVFIQVFQFILIYRIYRILESKTDIKERDSLYKFKVFGLGAVLVLSPLYGNTARAETEKINIAISQFNNDSGGSRCGFIFGGWDYLGQDLRDQLITEIMEYSSKFKVLERKNLRQMYEEEHELINSKKSKLPMKNQFESAKYSITGAVTAFEMCENGGGIGLDIGSLVGLGGFGVEAKRTNSLVKLNIRIIDVETGEVIKSFVSEGEVSSTRLGFDIATLSGLRVSSSGFKNTPLGEATQKALKHAARIISETI